MIIAVTWKVSEQFDYNIQVVFCHEAITAPQNLSMGNCTSVALQFHLCIGMLWVLGGFHVRSLSEQHGTLYHPSGEFFWKFLVYVFHMVIIFVNNDLWFGKCLELWKCSNIWQAVLVLAVLMASFDQCSTISLTGLSESSQTLRFPLLLLK